MPYTPAQHRLFEAAAHNPAIAKAKGIPQAKAATMASEGIKKPRRIHPQVMAQALAKMGSSY